MQDAPERIWVAGTPQECGQYFPSCVEAEGAWGGVGVAYTRTNLCITETECQRRIDAAVAAEREACEAEVRRQFRIWEDFGASGFDDLCMAIIPEAIRARGQK